MPPTEELCLNESLLLATDIRHFSMLHIQGMLAAQKVANANASRWERDARLRKRALYYGKYVSGSGYKALCRASYSRHVGCAKNRQGKRTAFGAWSCALLRRFIRLPAIYIDSALRTAAAATRV